MIIWGGRGGYGYFGNNTNAKHTAPPVVFNKEEAERTVQTPEAEVVYDVGMDEAVTIQFEKALNKATISNQVITLTKNNGETVPLCEEGGAYHIKVSESVQYQNGDTLESTIKRDVYIQREEVAKAKRNDHDIALPFLELQFTEKPAVHLCARN
ncbi:hypothetical protein [Pontibacillus salipaludis]|uniref:Uncharacterized protein n=1 Tax=Pontibacillus salipaludis TaxID=1697394 RepID=A0ABQ1Q1M9_9BACI|nr:hypothetical protein [Pontibacillus salipaludis]GGD09988.1 hypothetical protein GCM10011389_16890 [Pontibacillus salipaludis]